jgi:hypothetical protein
MKDINFLSQYSVHFSNVRYQTRHLTRVPDHTVHPRFDSALKSWHIVDVGNVAEVSVIYTGSIFRVGVSRV